MVFRALHVLALVAALFTTELALAQTRDEEAHRLYEAGEIAFADGRYEVALERFRESHELSGRGELLYNAGVCLDRLRRDDEAIASYERYLEAVPDAANRQDVETRLDAMRTARALRLSQTGDSDSSPRVEDFWWAFALGGLVLAAAVAVPIVIVTQSGTEPPIPGMFGEGGVIAALELRP